MKRSAFVLALLVLLSAAGCNSGSSLTDIPPLPTDLFGRLYVVNTNGNSACSFSANTAGDQAPTTALGGAATTLANPFHLAADRARNILYVSNSGNNSVLIFDNASQITGDVAPSRTLQGANTLLNGPGGISVDPGRDLLYVGNINSNAVTVYAGASLLTGNTAPTRQITGLNNTPYGLVVEPDSDRLYVSLSGTSSIGVWDAASTLNGAVAPVRQIVGAATLLATPDGLAVDPVADILYVADQGGQVLGFANASAANGNVAPGQTLSGVTTTLGSPRGVAVDSSRQILYCADFANNSLCAFLNSRTVTGNVAPSSRIVGPNTLLNAPTGLALDPTR